MCCSATLESPDANNSYSIYQKLNSVQKLGRDARITAVVLCMLSIFFLAGACFLYGLGSLNPEALAGLGMVPYLGGVCLNLLSLGLLVGGGIFGILALVST